MSNTNCNGVNRILLGTCMILLTLLFPSYALPLGQSTSPQAQHSPSLPTIPKGGTPITTKTWNLWLRANLDRFSTPVMKQVAKALGITNVHGKAVNPPSLPASRKARPALPSGLNIPVVTYESTDAEQPSIAFDPVHDQKGYAVWIEDSSFCSFSYTTNGGLTWTPWGGFELPLNSGTDTCADPVVRWAPDDGAAYFVYLSVKHGASGVTTSDVNVCIDYNPPSGGCTKTILQSGLAHVDFSDKPWVDVHQMDNAIVNVQGEPSQAGWVYVTWEYSDMPSGTFQVIALARSTNYGGTWDPPLGFGGYLVSTFPSSDSFVSFGRAIGGMYNTGSSAGDVLVCWYKEDTDGFLTGHFTIQCRHSDHNAASNSWYGIVDVAHNVNYELPYYLCPNDDFEVWWGGMQPSIAVSPDGRAHVVFAASTYDYKDGLTGTPANKVDCGEIKYVESKPFLYDTAASWQPIKTIAGGSSAQGFPTIAAQQRPPLPPTSLGYRLYLFYYDAKNSPSSPCSQAFVKAHSGGNCANILYDVYMRVSNNGGSSWSSDTRITDQSSLVDYDFIGDHFDSAATNRKVWVIWADRADKLSIHDEQDDIYTQPVSSQ